jgi:hypothetical protein
MTAYNPWLLRTPYCAVKPAHQGHPGSCSIASAIFGPSSIIVVPSSAFALQSGQRSGLPTGGRDGL